MLIKKSIGLRNIENVIKTKNCHILCGSFWLQCSKINYLFSQSSGIFPQNPQGSPESLKLLF